LTLSGTKVLVTGAGGFIGSHLAEALVRDGAHVRAFLHYNSAGSTGWLRRSEVEGEIEPFFGDIADRDTVRRAFEGVEVAFHLAALIGIPYSYAAPASYIRTNVEGTLNALEAAREKGIRRLVLTSTSEVYGTARRVPIDESHPLCAQSPYAASKIAADKLGEAYHHSFGVEVVTVRPFNTFGPRQSMRAVVPSIAAQCIERAPLISLGNLHPTRDLTYVDDTVAGFLCAAVAEGASGGTFNLGTGREISIGDLARLIAEMTGSSAAIEVDARRTRREGSEVSRLLSDNSLARSALSWEPRVSLEDGLFRTIEWLERNRPASRPEGYAV